MQNAKTGTADAATIARTEPGAREDVLAKLLQHGMRTLESLSQTTGWEEADTQKTLLSLIAAGRADCRIRDGRRMYAGREPMHVRA
ncbi:hypothetical protein LJR039_007242 [Pseudorhodoferax sp. LjRoot39]|uniref:hypothetical protein n=1 Tax=Pseudorhodoferax sp. LjRoot39 TaxID=3342328 RepID=UPI003ED0A868